MESLAGSISSAKKLKIGYYAQHQVDELNQQSTPFELIVPMLMKEASMKFRKPPALR